MEMVRRQKEVLDGYIQGVVGRQENVGDVLSANKFHNKCELNFQNHPKAFIKDCAKVIFAQLYLKGMALEWFELDLLQMEDLALNSTWMNDFKEFVLELQTNFGPHDPVGDVEHLLDHLFMKDGQCINKYVVEFNWIALQVQVYREGALQHHFYNGLPD